VAKFGNPTMSESERRAAIARAERKWCPRTRHLANAVPPPLHTWLLGNEAALASGRPVPAMPAAVFAWFEARGISFGISDACGVYGPSSIKSEAGR